MAAGFYQECLCTFSIHPSFSYMKRAQSVLVLPPDVSHLTSYSQARLNVCHQSLNTPQHAFFFSSGVCGEGERRPWRSWILERPSDHSSHSSVWHLVASTCSPSLCFWSRQYVFQQQVCEERELIGFNPDQMFLVGHLSNDTPFYGPLVGSQPADIHLY